MKKDIDKIELAYNELSESNNLEQIKIDLQQICECRTFNPFLYDSKYKGWSSQEFKLLLKKLENFI
jgi:hypothetical protein